MDHSEILSHFGIQGDILEDHPFGSGHINDTQKVTVSNCYGQKEYILQRINTSIFPDPDILMDNAVKVTDYLRGVIAERGGDPVRGTLHFYSADNGKYYYIDPDGLCWRVEDMIPGTMSYDLCTSPEMFESTGYAFGSFMSDLGGFPASELGEVIPNFHNTRVRFQTFEKEVREDRSGRIGTCRKEVDFALARRDLSETLVKQLENGTLPLRVTHNDTKINNILMDVKTKEPVCIVDLDTIMPGACGYDFGDSIRFGASSALEDEQDLSRVYMRMDLFEAYTRGYMKAVGRTITQAEADSLAVSAIVITFETGIRFLGDHLNGDVYFKVSREGHNLDRARTQFKLVADMEQKLPQMNRIVQQYYQMAHEQ